MVVWFLILLFRRWRRYYYFGDGLQTRSFQYVDDLVEGMIRMMNSEDGFLGPVNIGNPNEFTMLELAEAVIALTQSKSK
jgi:UDP-glucuronate decarboxylase